MNLQGLEQADASLDLARAALDASRPDEAMAHLRRAMSLCPDLPMARVLEARIQLALNQPDQALAALDLHHLHAPHEQDQPPVALLRIQALAQAGHHEMALRLLRRLAEAFPDDSRPQRMMAGLLLETGEQARAIEAMRQVLRLEPSDHALRHTLARLLASEDPQAGVQVISDDPAWRSDPIAAQQAARLLAKVGRLADAEAIYRDLLAVYDEDAGLWIESGELADAMGQDAIAQARLTRAVSLGPAMRMRALTALATVHMHAGRLKQAGRTWWRIVRQHDGDCQAWSGLLICATLTDHRRAVHRAQRALIVHSSRQERRIALAAAWHHAAAAVIGQRAGANMADVDRKIRPRPSRPSPLNVLLRDAAHTLENTALHWSRRADMHYHLAMCRYAMGQREAAGKAVKTAIDINPNYDAAHRLLTRLRGVSTPRLAA